MTRSTLALLTMIYAATLLGGCVERKLTITSEPAGALVYMNDREVGRTPIETDFLWYGNYDVQVRREGYQTINQPQKLTAPWWQWPPFDLFAEMMPNHPTDRQSMHFTMTPAQPEDVTAETLIDRAGQLQAKLESPPSRK